MGALVGVGCGWLLGWAPGWLPAAALLGAGCGLAVGRFIIRRSRQRSIRRSRQRSASLILAGNRTVLEDIGLQTARFVDWLTQSAAAPQLADFLVGLPAGPASPELLRQAFTHYFEARAASSVAEK